VLRKYFLTILYQSLLSHLPHAQLANRSFSHCPAQSYSILTTQDGKQTSIDPSGQTWNYRGIMLLYKL